ncbi:hypothetical protein M8J76_003495 [Diaphorina citri]|nr:hypothetical protein M8J76_003495 [Diaphorina citri]
MPRCYMIKKCPPSGGKLSFGKAGSTTIVKIQVVKPVSNRLTVVKARKLPELPVLIPLKPVEVPRSKYAALTEAAPESAPPVLVTRLDLGTRRKRESSEISRLKTLPSIEKD